MRTTGASVLALAALMTPALCQIKQASVIRVPSCAINGHGDADKIWEVKASACQDALLSLYNRGRDVINAPSSGCSRIVSVDPCDVFLCAGDNGSQGRISAGVLATAAQDIHAYCRLNGKVGGRVAVAAPGGKPDGSVIVQIGVIPKDELKVRELEQPAEELLTHTPSMRRFRRSDEDLGLAVADGVSEGDEVDMNTAEMQDMAAGLYNDVVRVRNEPNRNWRNTAAVEREYTDNEGTFTIVMGYLSRDGRTIDDLGNDETRIDELIQEAVGNWWHHGQPTMFSIHLFRRFRNAREEEYHMPLGEFIVNAERGNRGNILLPAPAGSGPM